MVTEKNTGILQKNHKLCLNERQDLSISGVVKVEAFSDKEITLITVMGKLLIKGENLHIEKLDVDSGEFVSTGRISSMIYSKASANKGSFIERVFK